MIRTHWLSGFLLVVCVQMNACPGQEFNSRPLEPLGLQTSAEPSPDLRFGAEFVTRRVTETKFRHLQSEGWQLMSYEEHPATQKAIISWREVVALREPRFEDVFTNGYEAQLGPEQSLVVPLLTTDEKTVRSQWLRRRLNSLTDELDVQHEKLRLLRTPASETLAAARADGDAIRITSERAIMALLQLRQHLRVELFALSPFTEQKDAPRPQ